WPYTFQILKQTLPASGIIRCSGCDFLTMAPEIAHPANRFLGGSPSIEQPHGVSWYEVTRRQRCSAAGSVSQYFRSVMIAERVVHVAQEVRPARKARRQRPFLVEIGERIRRRHSLLALCFLVNSA